MRPLRILTWHVHGNYLYYLSHAGHEFYLPVRPGRHEGYGGRGGSFPWADNVIDVPAEAVKTMDFDCILFQSRRNFCEDQYAILSRSQQRLPRIYVEHDPPREHPTDTRHPVDDPDVLLVHVTQFNNLMWNNGRTPTRVIEHGVVVPEGVRYKGDIARGLVVINNLPARGRRRAPMSSSACAPWFLSISWGWTQERWAVWEKCLHPSSRLLPRAIASSSTRFATRVSAWPSVRR